MIDIDAKDRTRKGDTPSEAKSLFVDAAMAATRYR